MRHKKDFILRNEKKSIRIDVEMRVNETRAYFSSFNYHLSSEAIGHKF